MTPKQPFFSHAFLRLCLAALAIYLALLGFSLSQFLFQGTAWTKTPAAGLELMCLLILLPIGIALASDRK